MLAGNAAFNIHSHDEWGKVGHIDWHGFSSCPVNANVSNNRLELMTDHRDTL
ncbi:MAG: hypothetical protein ABJ215_17745 [Alphaproteobacteria bacterium]